MGFSEDGNFIEGFFNATLLSLPLWMIIFLLAKSLSNIV